MYNAYGRAVTLKQSSWNWGLVNSSTDCTTWYRVAALLPVSYTHLVFYMANDNSRKFKQNQIMFCIQHSIVEFSRPIVFSEDRLRKRGSLPATFNVLTCIIFSMTNDNFRKFNQNTNNVLQTFLNYTELNVCWFWWRSVKGLSLIHIYSRPIVFGEGKG